MQKSSCDKRTLRTKMMIRNALAELIEEKGFNEISVTDLTQKANINRGTFYLHYTDKYDLLEQTENEVLLDLNERAKTLEYVDLFALDAATEPIPFIIALFEYFKENALFMKAILGAKGDPFFHTKIKNLIQTNLFEKKLYKRTKYRESLIPESYFISYILSAHLGVLLQWLEEDMRQSPPEMALMLSKMLLLGPFTAAGLRHPS